MTPAFGKRRKRINKRNVLMESNDEKPKSYPPGKGDRGGKCGKPHYYPALMSDGRKA